MPKKPPITIRELFLNALMYHIVFMFLFGISAVTRALEGSWLALLWFAFLVASVVEFFRILGAYREFRQFRREMEGVNEDF